AAAPLRRRSGARVLRARRGPAQSLPRAPRGRDARRSFHPARAHPEAAREAGRLLRLQQRQEALTMEASEQGRVEAEISRRYWAMRPRRALGAAINDAFGRYQRGLDRTGWSQRITSSWNRYHGFDADGGPATSADVIPGGEQGEIELV